MRLIQKIITLLSPNNETNKKLYVWKYLISKEDIEKLYESSKDKPQIVFKHSPSCGISFFAKRSLDTPELLENELIDLHMIDVIKQRSMSQSFAEKISIRHESPQVFVIKGCMAWFAYFSNC